MSAATFPEIMAALARVIGPLPELPRRVQTSDEWEAEQCAIERHQDNLHWAGYATPAEMDGAAADAWYRDRGGWDA